MTDNTTAEVKVSFRSAYGFMVAGTRVAADHPVVSRYPSMFADKVRTTAAVPETTDPPGVVRARPPLNAPKSDWTAYAEALGGTVDDDMTKADVQALADELEG